MSLTTSASSAFEAVNTAAASACESNAILVDLPDGQQANVLWVTLEGPIGAGKTELTKVLMPALRAEYGDNRVFFVAEPIDELLASGLFQDYQRDPVRWAFEFQIACFDLRTDYFRAAWEAMCAKVAATSAPQDAMHCGIKTVVMLSERSIVSDTCFMRVQYVYGHCSERNKHKSSLQRYLKLNIKWRALYKGVAPGLVVYCRPGPVQQAQTSEIIGICQRRIKERARDAEEKLVTPEYNQKVLEEHDRVFGQGSPLAFSEGFGHRALSIPIVIVDTTENYRDDPRVALKKSGELLHLIRLQVPVMQ